VFLLVAEEERGSRVGQRSWGPPPDTSLNRTQGDAPMQEDVSRMLPSLMHTDRAAPFATQQNLASVPECPAPLVINRPVSSAPKLESQRRGAATRWWPLAKRRYKKLHFPKAAAKATKRNC